MPSISLVLRRNISAALPVRAIMASPIFGSKPKIFDMAHRLIFSA